MRVDRAKLSESVLVGLFMALGYSLWMLVVVLVSGATVVERLGLSVAELLGLYFAGGVAGGTLVGLLRPLARNIFGAMLLGYVAVVPFAFAFYLVTLKPDEWPTVGIVLTLVVSLFGAGLGAVIWSEERQKHKGRR